MNLNQLNPVLATPLSVDGYAQWVDSFRLAPVDVVQWPNQGYRRLIGGHHAPMIEDSLTLRWLEDELEMTGDSAYNTDDSRVVGHKRSEDKLSLLVVEMLSRRLDSGVVLFAQDPSPILVPIAKSGKDGQPNDMRVFRIEPETGVHIAPGVWFGDPITTSENATLLRKHGSVRASHGCNLVTEFGKPLSIKLTAPGKAIQSAA